MNLFQSLRSDFKQFCSSFSDFSPTHDTILKIIPSQLERTNQPDAMSSSLNHVIIPVSFTVFLPLPCPRFVAVKGKRESPMVCSISDQWRVYPQAVGEASRGTEESRTCMGKQRLLSCRLKILIPQVKDQWRAYPQAKIVVVYVPEFLQQIKYKSAHTEFHT